MTAALRLDDDLALIDAGGANLGSVRYALARLGVQPRLVRDADELGMPTRVILPGVGAAGAAMRLLRARGLDTALRASEAPLLGICLGMQLLFESSEEGEVDCLGLIPGRVMRMAGGPGLRVPHMGWNRLTFRVRADDVSPLLDGIDDGAHAYFVHGYAVPVLDCTIAACTHGQPFSAVVAQGRRYGMQFHPERSSQVGLRLLENFLKVPA
ncbi:imidazole glycerol phosphate synthase subunit HisH [Lysobacter brunescens]|uniref:Imidazole glycerol phosphate synthase subunit HisH n=1 Tax=Lysobacter brunescens TaxID=262323 RepID=A0ABW2YHH2_9GAMM